jgi:hypothetical protein
MAAAEGLARAIHRDLLPLLAVTKFPVLLAIDQVEAAAHLDHQYISSNRNTGQSLLFPLLLAANTFQIQSPVSIFVSRTSSSQDRYDSRTSNIGKDEIGQMVASDFPLATRRDVERILLTLPDITNNMFDDLSNLDYLVNARFALVARSVEIFMQCTDETDPKVRLLSSIDGSVTQHKEMLMALIKEELGPISTKEDKSRSLSRIHAAYVASKLSNSRMDFTSSYLDLCCIGLGALLKKDVYRVSERFALEVVEDFFESIPGLEARLEFRQSMTDLATVNRACRGTVTAKGHLFENLVFHAFRRPSFQGKPVSELGFVSTLKNIEEEARKRNEWSSVIFKCDAVQTPPINATDPQFVHGHPNVLVSPQECHRADGVMYLPENHLLEV